MDLELLVDEPMNPAKLSDDIFANMLDRFWEAESKRILSTIVLTILTTFDLPPDHVLHSDATSHTVYSDYEASESDPDPSRIKPAWE